MYYILREYDKKDTLFYCAKLISGYFLLEDIIVNKWIKPFWILILMERPNK